MKKILFLTILLLALLLTWYSTKKPAFIYFVKHFTFPITASTHKEIWQPFLTFVGTLTATNNIAINVATSGIVKDIRFQSGQYVKKNDVLIVLDTHAEEAQLKEMELKLKLAETTYNREQILAQQHLISELTLQSSRAKLEEIQNAVQKTKNIIKQKIITAPFSGKVGIRQINMGEMVSAGKTVITLQTLNPLYVQFNLPEQYLPLLYLQQPVDVTINVIGRTVVHGKITAIHAKLSEETKNILIQATITNNNMLLYPGMFALIKIWLPKKNPSITLPESSISYNSIFTTELWPFVVTA